MRALVPAAVSATLAVVVVGGCALKSPPGKDEVRAEALPNVRMPDNWSAKGGARGAVLNEWITTFRDPELEALVKEALEFNYDLRVAAARVEQAAAYAKAAGAKLYPQVNLLARGGGKASGDGSGLEGVGIVAGWEIDLWGRIRSGREAATLQYVSAQLDTEYARQSISALVAKSWFLATEAKLQKAIAEGMAVAADQLIGLADDRLRIGKGDAYDVAL